MWGFIFSVLGSSIVKSAIIAGVRALVQHKTDGVTKDVTIAILDGIASSKANNVPLNAFDEIKSTL